jgi:formate dehydrogenase subunit gamma
VYVTRFTPTERALHWVHATSFFALLATGVALYVPELTAAFGSRALLRELHLAIAVAWILALLAVVVLGDRRALRRTLRDLDVLDEDDRTWGLRRMDVPQGRFNAGQKRNAAITAAFAVLFVVSGLLLWYGARDNDFSLASAVLLHDALTLLAIVLVAGHLYLALIHPSTRHALRGMTLGTVRADWARKHHAKWSPEQRD